MQHLETDVFGHNANLDEVHTSNVTHLTFSDYNAIKLWIDKMVTRESLPCARKLRKTNKGFGMEIIVC